MEVDNGQIRGSILDGFPISMDGGSKLDAAWTERSETGATQKEKGVLRGRTG